MFGKNDDGITMTEVSTHNGTLIGKAVKVEGALVAKENIRIEGVVEGQIKTEQHLIVGEGAVINADIMAATAYIAGDVKGNVEVKDKLELSKTAKINGNVSARTVTMAEGAVLNGNFKMGEVISDNKNNNNNKNLKFDAKTVSAEEK